MRSSHAMRLAPAGASTGAAPAVAPPRSRRFVTNAELEDDVQPMHPRGVGQILDTGLDVLVARFGPSVAIAAAFFLPYSLLNEIVVTSGISFEAHLVWSATRLLPETLTTACLSSFVGGYLLRREVSSADAVRAGLAATLGLVGITLIATVASALLVFCCVFPVFLAYWGATVVPTTFVLERKQLMRESGVRLVWPLSLVAEIGLSIRRSFQLIYGGRSFARWAGWSTVAFVAIIGPLASLPVLFESPEVRDALEDFLPRRGTPIQFFLTLVSAVFVGLGSAYYATLRAVYYVDQRVRKEAFDLELRLEEIEARAIRGAVTPAGNGSIRASESSSASGG